MPRFSSLRSLWTVARSGILLSIFVCVVSSNGAAFAQMDSDKTATMELGDPVDPMYSGSPGAQQQTATITNVGSGLKRSENSLAKIQALLYSDTTFVVRIDLNKIDYESVAAFVDEVVDKAGGTVQSNDEYLVSLRESQKANAKSSFKTLLSTLQNIFVQKAFNNKFDEVYLIAYQNDSGDSCQILATPIDGLSAEEQNAAIDAIESIWSPITIFKRYGFVVATYSHDKAVQPDIDEITSRYEAKAREEQKTPAYGSYSASGSNNNSYDSYGDRGGSMSANPMMGGVTMGGTMGGAQSASNMSSLLADYQAEVEKAVKNARADSRKAVLPFIRKRFEKPASAEDGKKVFDCLRQGDGAAVTVAMTNLEELAKLANSGLNSDDDDDVASPFAGLGAADDDGEEDPNIASITEEAKKNMDAVNLAKAYTLSLSLVGSPKLVIVGHFNSADDAKTLGDALQASYVVIKPLAKKFLDEQLAEAEVPEDQLVDFTPLLDDLFNGAKPQVSGSKVGIVVDLDAIKKNASLFLPLLGGKEAKSEQELESESIDWGAADGDSDDADSADAADDDDPFNDGDADEDEDAAPEKEDGGSDDDDPFGSDEDDPFA